MSRAAAKEAGTELETTVVDGQDGLEAVPDAEAEWYDARTTVPLPASQQLPLAGLLAVPAETPVEIKAAQVRTEGGRIRGRWYFKRRAHEQLLEAGGVYYLVVYDPAAGDDGEREPVAELVVSAEVVDQAISSWIDVSGRRSEQQVAKLSWSVLIDPAEVPGEGGEQA